MKGEVEEWRDIEGFPGYQVSNLGRVKSLGRYVGSKGGSKKYLPERILKGTDNSNAIMVSLCYSYGKGQKPSSRVVAIARLVLTAFTRKPNKGEACVHLDGNRSNNHVSNLRWATYAEKESNLRWQSKGTRTDPIELTATDIALLVKQAKKSSIARVARKTGINYDTVKHLVQQTVHWFVPNKGVEVTSQTEFILVRRTPEERWKKIPGIPGYIISSQANIIEVDWTTALLLDGHRLFASRPVHAWTVAQGYKAVQLWLQSKSGPKKGVTQLVHRLVAAAFMGEPTGLNDEVRHLDGDPSNNKADNLAYGSAKENSADKVLHGTTNRGSAHGMSKLTEQDVIALRVTYAAGQASQEKLAAKYGVSRETIGQIVRGESWGHLTSPITHKKKPHPVTSKTEIDFHAIWEKWAYLPKKNERWLDVPNYEGYYQASNSGQVRSVDRWVINSSKGGKALRHGKLLHGGVNGRYLYAQLRMSKSDPNYRPSTQLAIHQIVAMTFFGPCPEGYVVCHVNDIGNDNRVENLYYGTPQDNAEDSRRHGTLAMKLTEQDVADIRDLWERQRSLPRSQCVNHTQLAEKYGVCAGLITKVVSKKSGYRRRGT